MTSELDMQMIRRALELSERGRGSVEPNPLVGAVITREGRIIGEGWHQHYGGPHAEVHAIAAAGHATPGSTLYVTLEPCCHTGKTPPCTEAILRAGITRVVACMQDPFPRVAGKGSRLLLAAGVQVEIGLAEAEARLQNAPYLKRLQTGRPYVIAKWAMTLDGKIATCSGESRWITGEAARARVHELRGRMDAILVGIGTALTDDPLLTVRPPGPRVPARVVLDRHLRLPLNSRLVQSAREVPLLLVHSADADPTKRAALQDAGCQCLLLAVPDNTATLATVLDELGRRGATNVLAEGGSRVLGALFDSNEIDEVYAFVAPHVVGGAAAPSPIAGLGRRRMAERAALRHIRMEVLETDYLIRGVLGPEW